MKTLVTNANLSKALSKWAFPVYHSHFLAPLLSIQECERAKAIVTGKDAPLWMWTTARIVAKSHELIWQMSGEWQARRSKTITQPRRFFSYTTEAVVRLAKTFNRHKVLSLADLGKFDQSTYEWVVKQIESSISKISRTRSTEAIQPVLGSKVLHHFFPSIIPVFDDALISKRVLRLPEFIGFVETNRDGWLFARHANHPRMLEYHRYLAFCAQQISETPSKVLKRVRERFMSNFRDLAPRILSDRGLNGLLGRLDAKIAEYCLIGRTY